MTSVTDTELPARRLTPTERAHELMLQMLQAITGALTKRSTIQHDSLSTSRNAKADVQFEVVTYQNEDESEADFTARHDARYDHLHEKHPPSRAQNFGRDYLPNEKGTK